MLTRRSGIIGAAGAALAALTAAGCARNAQAVSAARATSAAPAAGTGTARLVVQNQNFADMKVYAARSGSVAARLGMATGLSTTTFAIPPSLFYDGTLELVVRPIGGTSVTGSGQLLVSSGQTITFTIQPLLPASMATVR